MSLTEDDNSEVIADLQSRRFILAVIFYGGLAAIPLGVICPCGLAAVVRRFAPDWSQDVALSSFFLPLVGLAAALLVVGSRSRAKRSLTLARMADAMSHRLTLQPPRERLDFLTSFPFLNELQVAHSGRGANLLEGVYKGRPLTAVDYTSLHLLGYKHFVRSQTVAVFTQGFDALPTFAVVPQTFFDRLDQALFSAPPGETFKIPGDKEFNRRFALVGEDRAGVLSCLTAEIVDLVLEDSRTTIEVHDGMLLVAYRRTIVSAAEYEDFLRAASRIAKALDKARKERI
jgi:hypothetical protein